MIDTEQVHKAATEIKEHLSTPDVALIREEASRRNKLRRQVSGVGIVMLLVVGGFGLTQLSGRSNQTSLDTASGEASSSTNVPPTSTNQPVTASEEAEQFVVFLRSSSTAGELDEIDIILSENDRDFVFVSKEDTYDEFVEYYIDDPELLDTISVETMPPSFRIEVGDSAADRLLKERLEALPQVRSVVSSTDSRTADQFADTALDNEEPLETIQLVEVPSLSGLLIDDAVSIAQDVGLTVQIVTVDEPPTKPEHVVRTDPPAGTEVEANSTLTLTMQASLDDPLDPEEAAFLNRAGRKGVGLTADLELVEIDLATGEATRDIAVLGEARTFGAPQLNHDGSAVYLSEAVEDSWFSCETSRGSILRIDLATGDIVTVGQGTEPRISPNGAQLAYLTASTCIPDPQAPNDWVLTVTDSVVVRDLSTGTERRWVDEDLQSAIQNSTEADLIEAQYSGLTWVSNDEIALGTLRLSAETMTDVGFGASTKPEAGSRPWQVLGFHDESQMFVVTQPSGSGNVEIVTFTNASSPTFARYGTATAAALDSTNQNLAVIDGSTLWFDGASVKLEIDLLAFDW